MGKRGHPQPRTERIASKGKVRKKPYLVRLLNNLGIRTGETTEWLLDWVQVLAIATLLAYLVLTFVLIRMSVPSGSMIPTVELKDSLFVDKISYHF
jgi:signal peptidase I